MSKRLYLCLDARLEADDPSNPYIIVKAESDKEAIKIAERESIFHKSVKWEAIVCDNKNGDVYKNKETQKAAYEEQCERGFVHQEQPNEDYFEGLNDYLDGTMSI